jgi:hypothetical protein
LQSEIHETLYRSLADITVRVKATLGEDDARALMDLAGEHRDVMDKLDWAGISRDPDLLEMIQKTRDQVYLAIAEIGRQRDELGRQLGMRAKKKMVSSAYAGNKKTKTAFI